MQSLITDHKTLERMAAVVRRHPEGVMELLVELQGSKLKVELLKQKCILLEAREEMMEQRLEASKMLVDEAHKELSSTDEGEEWMELYYKLKDVEICATVTAARASAMAANICL